MSLIKHQVDLYSKSRIQIFFQSFVLRFNQLAGIYNYKFTLIQQICCTVKAQSGKYHQLVLSDRLPQHEMKQKRTAVNPDFSSVSELSFFSFPSILFHQTLFLDSYRQTCNTTITNWSRMNAQAGIINHVCFNQTIKNISALG